MKTFTDFLNETNEPNEKKKLLAVIVKGNPKLIKTKLAKDYYEKIKDHLEKRGCNVEYDSGEPHTTPRLDADLYVGHSRGTDRCDFMPKKKQKVFLKFGIPSGIIAPDDLKWQQSQTSFGDVTPPDSHFDFSDQQKDSIDNLLTKIKR